MITLYREFGMPEMTKDSMRRSFKAYDQYADKGWISQPKNFDIPNKEVIEYNAEKNVTTSDKVISLDSNDINNPEVLLRSHGFNPEEFILISARNSKWQQGTKDGNKTLYSSKISVRPRKAQDITFEDIDKNTLRIREYNDNINRVVSEQIIKWYKFKDKKISFAINKTRKCILWRNKGYLRKLF